MPLAAAPSDPYQEAAVWPCCQLRPPLSASDLRRMLPDPIPLQAQLVLSAELSPPFGLLQECSSADPPL
jgi:hypothetical protein